jgi:hypothetical protein
MQDFRTHGLTVMEQVSAVNNGVNVPSFGDKVRVGLQYVLEALIAPVFQNWAVGGCVKMAISKKEDLCHW